jgi:hypothetical protein
MVIVICQGDGCWKEFSVSEYKLRNGVGKYCSKQCYYDSKKGKTLTEKHKRKIGASTKARWEDGTFGSEEHLSKLKGKTPWNKGISPSEETKKKMSVSQRKRYEDPRASILASEKMQKFWDDPKEREKQSERMKKMHEDDPTIRVRVSETLQGRIFTDEHREKLSISSRHRKDLQGENSRWWKGGVSEEIYPPEFNEYLKRKIKQRDNYECQSCGQDVYDSRYGQVHHMDGNKQNCVEENLILVCQTCHNAIHERNTITSDKIEKFKSMLYQ